jgi:protein lysine acetyltransferase
VRLPEAPDTAEFAIVVGDALQGRGLGTLMARELATAARAVGIRRFAATMLGDNVAVRRLMGTISAHLELEKIEAGVREVVVDLAA